MTSQSILSTLRDIAGSTIARNQRALGLYGPSTAGTPPKPRAPIEPRSLQQKLDVATRMSDEEKMVHTGWNNHDDAQRHAEWSKRMADELGPMFSTGVGLGHEIAEMWPSELGGRGQPISEMVMDLHNNAEGVQASREGRDIDPRRMMDRPFHPGAWIRDRWRVQ